MARPRHLKPGTRRRTALLSGTAFIIAFALIATAYGAFREHSRGTASGGLPVPEASGTPVPDFTFGLTGVQPIATGAKRDAVAAAHSAALHIEQTLDTLYLTGFLDPNTWVTGRYGGAWQLFTPDAVRTARTDDATLTLGPDAGRMYSAVRPHAGQLQVRVLMDRLGHPSTAVAVVSFSARALRKDGARGVIRSAGHYFLRPSSHGWLIYGYDVNRDDAVLSATGATS
ncbi:MAG: hypothetical protein ABR600_11460 [Actinomycetota bacterium]